MPSHKQAFLLPYYPRLIHLALRERGFQDAQIFEGLQLTAAQLQDETYRLSLAQHESFILRVLDLTEDPHFALRLKQMQDQSSGHLTMLAVANSGRIDRALELVTRYNKVVTRVFTVRFTREDDAAVMDIELHLRHPRVIYFAVTSLALFIDGFFREVLKGAHLVRALDLSIPPPEDFDSARPRYPFAVAFDQPGCRLHFEPELLQRPMQAADPQTARLLLEMSERQLAEAERETGLTGAVKSLLVNQVASPPRLDNAARQLAMSPRSLRRKLEQEGTTYQAILDEVREEMASRLIRETDAPIATIAYDMGFGNASDFSRAFKKWTGRSPASLRTD